MKTENKQLMEAVSQICEVGVNYSLKIKKADRPQIKKSKQAADILRAWYDKTGMFEQKEIFTVLLLNKANDFIGLLEVSRGSVEACVVDIKYILRAAVLCNASALILCHNHPSGNLTPSEADKNITRKLTEGAKLIDVSVFDHIILAPDYEHYSFQDEGIF